MIGRTNAGGAGINFKVVGGTVQPQGKENLIWVNTSAPITNWVVSPNKPENPTEGMVWIQDGDANGINIIKKNTVEVFPSMCMQYINRAWKNADAYLFRNGVWVQFSYEHYYIVKNGVRIESNIDVLGYGAISQSDSYTRFASIGNDVGLFEIQIKPGLYTLLHIKTRSTSFWIGGYSGHAVSGKYKFTDVNQSEATLSPVPVGSVSLSTNVERTLQIGSDVAYIGLCVSGSNPIGAGYLEILDLWLE